MEVKKYDYAYRMTERFFPPYFVKEKWRENWVTMKRVCTF
jgi:hypothetical protein